MSNILLSGIVVLDIINRVDAYPEEDSEIRAIAQDIRRGGNASNTATVLAQLHHQCTLAASISNDHSGQFLTTDLENHNILIPKNCQLSGYSTPTSYITLSQKNGSRSIIHYRNLPELTFKQFETIPLDNFNWFHFEGRNTEETRKMMHKARNLNTPVSLEIEKNRDSIESLIPLADIIFLSRPYALSKEFTTANECLKHFNSLHPEKLFICTWGSEGASAIQNQDSFQCPAFKVNHVIDTIGAGDTFIAGFIHAKLNAFSNKDALVYACRLAGLKCSQNGLENLNISNV